MLAETHVPTELAPVRKPLFMPGFWKRNASRVALVLAYYVVALPAGIFRGGADNFGLPLRMHFSAVENVLLTDWPNRILQTDWLQPVPLQHMAAMIYISWFALPLTATLPLFTRKAANPWRLVGFVMLVYYAGMPFFALYPLQPPWAHDPDHIRRIFIDLHPEAANKDSNPFAAMPSLHVALPMAASLWYGWRTRWGKVMLAYACLIWFTVVYSGDHYVADGAGGALLATSVYGLVRLTKLPLLPNRQADEPADEPDRAQLPRAA